MKKLKFKFYKFTVEKWMSAKKVMVFNIDVNFVELARSMDDFNCA